MILCRRGTSSLDKPGFYKITLVQCTKKSRLSLHNWEEVIARPGLTLTP